MYTYTVPDPSSGLTNLFQNATFSGGQEVRVLEGDVPHHRYPSVDYVRGSDWGGGVGGILYSIRSTGPSFTHYNRRGDVTTKTDLSGAVTYQATYEAYGKRVTETGSTLDPQKSNTKDEDIPGYANEGFRFRDLETGVFISRDPAGFVDGPNLYAYVVQNPWTKFDPEGLFWDYIGGTVLGGMEAATGMSAKGSYSSEANSGRQLGRNAVTAAGAFLAVKGGIDAGGGAVLLGASITVEVGSGGTATIVAGPGAAIGAGNMAIGTVEAGIGTFVAANGMKLDPIPKSDSGGGTSPSGDSAKTTKEGGSHGEMTADTNDGLDSHHMPSKSALKESGLSESEGPAMKMEPADHQETASWGSSKEAEAYRAQQAKLIREGKFEEAQQMDVKDVQTKFGSKYNQGIKQAQDYTKTIPKKKTDPKPK